LERVGEKVTAYVKTTFPKTPKTLEPRSRKWMRLTEGASRQWMEKVTAKTQGRLLHKWSYPTAK
jgi:hypothetical protein